MDWTVNWGAYRQPVCKAWVSSQHGRIRVAAVYLVVQDPIRVNASANKTFHDLDSEVTQHHFYCTPWMHYKTS